MTPTPTEYAQILVSKFEWELPSVYNSHLEIGEGDYQTAKKCAIICCTEILENVPQFDDIEVLGKYPPNPAHQFFTEVLKVLKSNQ